jgi:predicted dithiol-disulfide oxidoreductase (DUF899 family)
MLSAVSRASLAKLQAKKRRMGWTYPWVSSLRSDFNFDFRVSLTEEQQREGGIEYNYPARGRRAAGPAIPRRGKRARPEIAAMTGTEVATYTRERLGMSVLVLEEGVGYRAYCSMRADWTASGVYQWLVPAARSRPQRAQREGRLVAPPRRVRHALSQVVGVVGATGNRTCRFPRIRLVCFGLSA